MLALTVLLKVKRIAAKDGTTIAAGTAGCKPYDFFVDE